MNLKSQVQSQYSYALSHKGKMIGSALGIVAGVTYGLAGKQSNWAVAGIAIGGMIGGAILGGMFDKAPTVVVPVDTNGNAKTPVVSDTAGEDGVASEFRGSRRPLRYTNAKPIVMSGGVRGGRGGSKVSKGVCSCFDPKTGNRGTCMSDSNGGCGCCGGGWEGTLK